MQKALPGTVRRFGTTGPSFAKHVEPRTEQRIPPYPHGRSRRYKQQDSGLYGGAEIRFGNSVSEKNEVKTRRVWRVNVQHKRLWSQALNEFVPLVLRARVLRAIDKVGGLDEYLVSHSPRRIKDLGIAGWRLRWRVMQTPTMRARVAEELDHLGIPAIGWRPPELSHQNMQMQEALRLAARFIDLQNSILEDEQETSQQQRSEGEGPNSVVYESEMLDYCEYIEEEIDALSASILEDLAEINLNSISLRNRVELNSIKEKFAEQDAALPAKLDLLAASLEEAALELRMTVPDLLKEAQTQQSFDVLEEAQHQGKVSLSESSSENARARSAEKHIVSTDMDPEIDSSSPEIDAAINDGAVEVLCERYQTELMDTFKKQRAERKAETTRVANRLWDQARQRSDYRKRTAWQTAWNRAILEVGPRPILSEMVPDGLTRQQWRYLLKSAKSPPAYPTVMQSEPLPPAADITSASLPYEEETEQRFVTTVDDRIASKKGLFAWLSKLSTTFTSDSSNASRIRIKSKL